MNAIILLSALVIFYGEASGQRGSIDYFGQKPPAGSAALFAKGLISTNLSEHSSPVFSPDGKTVLWTIMTMPSYRTMILEMNYENGKWSSPHTPSFSDTSSNEVYPSFSPDGQQLYFSSDRKAELTDTSIKGNRLWRVERKVNGWSIPVLLDSVITKGGEYASSISQSGNLYFTFGRFRSPDWNILLSENRNSLYSSPTRLALNTTGYEDGPFVAPDERYIIFESQRPESMNGSIDLFICFKNKDGQLGDPKNMGAKINTPFSERFARVSPDGKFLFFGSNRNETEIVKGFDIFWIDAKIIEELRNGN
jgi:Tol biopolymer transport system component